MKLLVTGSEGFIGQNLLVRLRESGNEVLTFSRCDGDAKLPNLIAHADFVFHLAGVNRPRDVSEYAAGNAELTRKLVQLLAQRRDAAIPVVLTSSTQAQFDNPYGRSKRHAEQALADYARATGALVYVYRLPKVFGKWCRPNYNSVVATFCHYVARDLPITVHDPAARLSLVYIDDVVEEFIRVARKHGNEPSDGIEGSFREVAPVYTTTVGDLAAAIRSFRQSRDSLTTERVGSGLMRGLYSTYVSHLPPEAFAYEIPKHADPRGEFAEVLKTPDCGQFSYFTAHPGVTRGGHYHHTKTEKFLVIRGKARFRFRHLLTGDFSEIVTSGDSPRIVETAPGWAHDITNIGDTEMIVMLWANELFDRDRPDTVDAKV